MDAEELSVGSTILCSKNVCSIFLIVEFDVELLSLLFAVLMSFKPWLAAYFHPFEN